MAPMLQEADGRVLPVAQEQYGSHAADAGTVWAPDAGVFGQADDQCQWPKACIVLNLTVMHMHNENRTGNKQNVGSTHKMRI